MTEEHDNRMKLRERAAQYLQEGKWRPDFGNEDPKALMHELHVHYAELELQAAELRAARNELRQSAEAYEALFQWLPAAILWLDAKGQILRANATATGLLGEVEERPLASLIPGVRRPAFNRWFNALTHSTNPLELHTCETLLMEGEQTRPVTLSGRSLVGEHPGSLLVRIVDRSTEAELEATRDILTVAFDQTAEMLMITDADLESGPTIIYANDALVQTMGYPLAELMGETPRIFQGPETTEASRRSIRAALRNGHPFHGEVINCTRDGEQRVIELLISPIFDTEGNITHFASRQLDVTEQKREARRQRSRQRLEAIGSLAGGIAHDFNNLLTVMGAVADEGATDFAGTPAEEMFKEIEEAVERAAGMTNQLLTFSRQGAGSPDRFCPITAVRRSASLLRRLLPEHIALELKLELTKGDAAITMDPTQFDQLIINLATNAREAILERGANPPGRITIGVTSDVLPETGAPAVRITLRDTGVGVAPEIAETLFEPFASTRLDRGGSGLGLATVYGIITGAGGTIDFETQLGEGTTFFVLLPRTQPQPRATSPRRRSLAPTQARVLLVEDNDSVRHVLERALRAHGLQVHSHPLPSSALEQLQVGEPIDIMITDVTMPEMSGPTLAAAARELMPDLPVLYISGYHASHLNADTLGPMDRVIPKPATASQLYEAIADLLKSDAA